MSSWGTNVYDNDMAQDVKADVQSLLSVGKNVEQIMEYVMEYYPGDGDEEECAFWTSLAYTLWKYELLPDMVRDRTVNIINNNNDVELYISDNDKEKRKKTLSEIKNTLQSVNAKPSKIKKVFVNRTQFHEGNILSFVVDGYYIFLHVVKIERSQNKIEELCSDEVYVKVFDIISKKLLSVQQLKNIPYKQLESDEQIQKLNENAKLYPPYVGLSKERIEEYKFIRWIYCFSDREKKKFESKMIEIGNLSYSAVKCDCVYADYQYAKLEETFIKLFSIREN